MFSKPALFLSFCAFLAGCSQDADFFSGYKINGGNTGFLVDVGDYRVGAGDIKALPKYKIPNTFYVTFSWSPEKTRQIHRKLGYRRATERDFNRIFAGPSTNKLTKAPNQEAMNKVRQRIFHGDYEHIVAPNGGIVSCGFRSSARWCGEPPLLSKTEAKSVAQIALSKAMPGCRITRLDPPEVVQLATSGQYNLPGSILAVVDCDR